MWWLLDKSVPFTFCYCFCTLSLAASQLNSLQALVLIKFYCNHKSGKRSVKFWTNKLRTSSITSLISSKLIRRIYAVFEKSKKHSRRTRFWSKGSSNFLLKNWQGLLAATSCHSPVSHFEFCRPSNAAWVREWAYLLEGSTSAFVMTGLKTRKLSAWLKRTVKVTLW